MESGRDDDGYFDEEADEWVDTSTYYEYQSNVGMWYAKVEYGQFDEGLKIARDGTCVVCFNDDYSSPMKAVDTAWKKRNDALAHFRKAEGVGGEAQQDIRRVKEEQTFE